MANSDSINFKELGDEELLLYLNTDDHRAVLHEIYDRFEKRIFFKCISMLKNKDEARDLTHDIFIKIFTKIGQFKGNSRLSLWVHRISVNSCIDYIRKKKKIAIIDHEDDLSEHYADDNEIKLQEKLLLEIQLDELDELLKQIKEEERLLIIMKYIDGLSIKDICSILDIGESAVKMKLKRSRDKLYKLFTSKSIINDPVY